MHTLMRRIYSSLPFVIIVHPYLLRRRPLALSCVRNVSVPNLYCDPQSLRLLSPRPETLSLCRISNLARRALTFIATYIALTTLLVDRL